MEIRRFETQSKAAAYLFDMARRGRKASIKRINNKWQVWVLARNQK